MRWGLEGASEALRSPIPWVTLSAAAALTYAGWIGLERSRVDEARTQFERRTETAESAIRMRLTSYEQVLRSGAARIASAPTVSRAEWHDFIAQLRLDERYPGIQSIGYAQRVTPAGRAAHVKSLRAEGLADYEISPPGDREEMFPIVYDETLTGRNARPLGFDMFSEPVRRAAMERASDGADATISGKVLLPGETYRGRQAQQPGFLMYMPVYRKDARTLTPGERRAQLAGFVFSPFRVDELLRGILDDGVLRVVDMRIYDEPGLGAADELIDTRTAWRASPTGRAPGFTRDVAFPMPGRFWTIRFSSGVHFDEEVAEGRSLVLLAAGSIASVMLFALTVALVAAWNRAQNLSMRDPLTSLYNRRYLDETMDRELPRARRRGESIGVIVLDIDHFKALNDSHGHDAGDFVLQRVADILRANTRNSDIACRFGGEEFAVVLPGASLHVARQRAEAIRAALEASRFRFGGKTLAPLTVSAGVAVLPPHSPDWAEKLQQADRALYTAKQAGRNRVIASVDE